MLMCSCKTQKLDSNVKLRNDVRSDLSYLNGSVKISAQNHAYFANEAQRIVIEEVIIATEYDKETGKPIKETKTERKTTQDFDKVVTKEGDQSVTDSHGLEVDHSIDANNKVESDVKEESTGGQESFGKWFGIVTACFIVLFLLYLWKKFRVS